MIKFANKKIIKNIFKFIYLINAKTEKFSKNIE